MEHQVLNDTSLATVATLGGNRHVYYQDQSGLLRESVYFAPTQNWSSPLSYTIATNAKNFTPISAVQVPGNISVSGNEEVRF